MSLITSTTRFYSVKQFGILSRQQANVLAERYDARAAAWDAALTAGRVRPASLSRAYMLMWDCRRVARRLREAVPLSERAVFLLERDEGDCAIAEEARRCEADAEATDCPYCGRRGVCIGLVSRGPYVECIQIASYEAWHDKAAAWEMWKGDF